MITPAMLVFIISNFCAFKNPTITKTAKIECAEWNSNCMIGPGGKSTNKLVNECKTQWVEIEKQNAGR